VLKIWGRTNSYNLQKVMWCVAELGLAHRRIDAGGAFGVTDEPGYRAMNPNGRVPTIEDDGFVLWESNAIVRYLAARHGMGTLCPADPRRHADADRWMTWQSATVGRNMRGLIHALFNPPPDQRDPVAAAPMIETALGHWAILDEHLTDRAFLLGPEFTMADIPMGAYALRWFGMDIARPAMPRLEAWYARLRDRDAYRTHVMAPFE
jgi:glutathione S-transferase